MITTKQEEEKVLFFWNEIKYIGYAYEECDGFYVFVFDGVSGSGWSENTLRLIAYKLRELNKNWHTYLDQHLID